MKARASRTALSVARLRAVHQVRDGGAIFDDPFAVALAGIDPDAVLQEDDPPAMRGVRRFIAARSRIGDDLLTRALDRGVSQAVILGAGFDTTALRHGSLLVLEVDHPATQQRKRARLAASGIAIPPGLRFVPLDFEQESLAPALDRGGFDPGSASIFLWFGVVTYLTRAAIDATLSLIAAMPNAEVVFDYTEPADARPAPMRPFVAGRERLAAAGGEPWISHFRAPEMATLLGGHGFAAWDDLDGAAIEAWLARNTKGMAGPPILLSHLVHARSCATRPNG